jgi:hypothetical protein
VPTTTTSIPSPKVVAGGGGRVVELWPGCPAGGGAGQFLAGSGGGGHVKVCLAAGDPPHDIMGVGPV